MAKSKLVQANKKIEEAVVGGYRKIEQTVVGGYQSIENTVVGIALGLVTWLIWRKMEGKAPIKVSGKTIGTVLLGIVEALLLDVGMCLSMVFGKMVLGIAVGIIGIVVLLMLIPLTKGLK